MTGILEDKYELELDVHTLITIVVALGLTSDSRIETSVNEGAEYIPAAMINEYIEGLDTFSLYVELKAAV